MDRSPSAPPTTAEWTVGAGFVTGKARAVEQQHGRAGAREPQRGSRARGARADYDGVPAGHDRPSRIDPWAEAPARPERASLKDARLRRAAPSGDGERNRAGLSMLTPARRRPHR